MKKADLESNVLSFLTPKQFTFFMEEGDTVRGFLEKAEYHKFTVVPVLDKEGKYIGSLSEGDVLRYIKNHNDFSLEKAERIRIEEVERYRSYLPAKVTVDLDEVFRLLLSQNYVPLVDDRGAFIGIVKRSSVMQYLQARAKEAPGEGEN